MDIIPGILMFLQFGFTYGSHLKIGSDTYDPLKFNSFPSISAHLVELNVTNSFMDLRSNEQTGPSDVSRKGYDVWLVHFSTDFSTDFSISKPVIWIDCGINGKDWMTHSTCMYIIDEINEVLQGRVDSYLVNVLEEYDFYIVPVVNPEGYVYSMESSANSLWIKNRQPSEEYDFCPGVNINRNFDVGWDYSVGNSDLACAEDFRGLSPESEAETQYLKKYLTEDRVKIDGVFHLEGSGQKWMYPYAYTVEAVPDHDELNEICEIAVEAIQSATPDESIYTCGQVSDIYGSDGFDTSLATGTLTDFAYKNLAINTTYSIALRSTEESAIENTAKEILAGILAVYRNILSPFPITPETSTEQNGIVNPSYDPMMFNSFRSISSHLEELNDTNAFMDLRSNGRTGQSDVSPRGYDVWLVHFSTDFNCNKSIIWIDCGMSGKDWMTHSTCMYIIDEINEALHGRVESYLINVLEAYDFYIVPVVNPEGYVYSMESSANSLWIKNRQPSEEYDFCPGVNINRNFDFLWDDIKGNSDLACAEDFRGLSPESEAETQYLKQYLTDDDVTIDGVFHLEGSGQKWMYPYAYSIDAAPDHDVLEANCEIAVKAVQNATPDESVFTCGQVSDIYVLDDLDTSLATGTLIDFAYKTLEITTTYSIASRSTKESAIENTAKEILAGILAIYKNILRSLPATSEVPSETIPTESSKITSTESAGSTSTDSSETTPFGSTERTSTEPHEPLSSTGASEVTSTQSDEPTSTDPSETTPQG